MVLLSLAIAHANGSLVSAVVDEERPQASRPSCPSTVWVASMSRTRGGSAALCEPGWCSCEPNTIDLPFPDQVPLRSGIASCARVGSNNQDGAHATSSPWLRIPDAPRCIEKSPNRL